MEPGAEGDFPLLSSPLHTQEMETDLKATNEGQTSKADNTRQTVCPTGTPRTSSRNPEGRFQ